MNRTVSACVAVCISFAPILSSTPAPAQMRCTFSKSAECTFLAACAKLPKSKTAKCDCVWTEVSKRVPEHQHEFLAEMTDLMFSADGNTPSPEQQQKLARLQQSPGFDPFFVFTLVDVFEAAKRTCPRT